jgi:hypothetical protein
MAIDFPNSPTLNQQFKSAGLTWTWDGAKWTATTQGTIGYPQLPPEVQQIPIAFPFAGKPPAGGLVNVPMSMSLTIAAALAGSAGFAVTAATASAAFTLNKISGGSTTALGTITFSGTTPAFAGAGGALAAGDTLQIVAPATQDTTLADLGVTILAMRV